MKNEKCQQCNDAGGCSWCEPAPGEYDSYFTADDNTSTETEEEYQEFFENSF